MRIDILTIFPELITANFNHSILKRAIEKGAVIIEVHDIRQYSKNKNKNVDDYTFGGAAGMVMMIQPIADCLDYLLSLRKYDEIIYLTPDGNTLNQPTANNLSMKNNIIMICGRYKGIDERIREHYVTKEISIGDYVLTGGEIAAIVLADSIIRIIPGVLNDETSALTDSFQDDLLSPPVYTRPANYKGWCVPEVLLSGHDEKIKNWNFEKAIEKTKIRRPDLWNKFTNN